MGILDGNGLNTGRELITFAKVKVNHTYAKDTVNTTLHFLRDRYYLNKLPPHAFSHNTSKFLSSSRRTTRQ